MNWDQPGCAAAGSRRNRPCGRPCSSGWSRRQRQGGASLIVSLLMLVSVMMLGLSAVQIALSSEKASRNDRDRQLAFQAAEAALIDAELDIQGSPVAALSRSQIFSPDSAIGFEPDAGAICGAGLLNTYLGLCRRNVGGLSPPWQSVDLAEADAAKTQSVPYGKFTGQIFPYGNGLASARAPRYVIELMNFTRPGESADKVSYFYRVTAIGFGIRSSTQVVLQTFFRKET